MDIRFATISDAEGIAKVHVDSWRTTYDNIIPKEFLQKLSYDQRTELWKRNISNEEEAIFVATTSLGKIVGFASCGKRKSNNVENSGDLTSIYLLAEFQGMGIGKKLLKQVFLKFKELRFDRIFVEVLEDNNTRYFYENYGAKLIKSEKITIGGAQLNLLTYEWDHVKKVLSKL